MTGITAGDGGGTRRLISASAVMAAGTLGSRVLGLVRVVLAAAVFGNGTRQADMLSLALTIPNALYILFAGGALNTVLVPQIVRAIKNDSDGGEAYVNRILTVFLGLVAVVTVVVVAAAPLITRVYAPDSWRAPELATQYSSMVLLTALCLPQIFFYGTFFLAGQILNARDKFGPMMWAPMANNLVQIALLVVYLGVWGTRVDTSAAFTSEQLWTLGLGSTLGIAVQTAVLIPFLRRTRMRFRLRFDVLHTGLGHTFHLAKWTLGFVAVNQLALVVVNNLALTATAGGAGAGLQVYNNAYLLWILPHSLVTVSLATAMLPSASRRAAAGDLDGVRDETLQTVNLATTAVVPAAAAFIALAFPIAGLFFGVGRGAADAEYVAWALIAFAVGLVPFSVQYVCLRAFYALEDTRSTFLLQCLIAGLNAAFALLLVLPFHEPSRVAGGLALAYSLAYVIGVYFSIRWLGRRLPGYALGPIARQVARLVVAVLPGAVAAGVAANLIEAAAPGWATRLSAIAFGAVILTGGYLLLARRMRIPEVEAILGLLRRRLRPATMGPTGAVPGEDPTTQIARNLANPAANEEGSQTVSAVLPPEDLESEPTTATRMQPPAVAAAEPDPAPATPSGAEPTLQHGSHDLVPLEDDAPDPEDPDEAVVAHVQPGMILAGRYRLERRIARRGTTLTYLAHDQVLSRPVNVHILRPHEPRTPQILEAARKAAVATDARFLRVLDAVDVATDPGLSATLGTDPTDELGSYVVTEHVEGRTLEQLLRGGPLSALEAVWVAREVADALASMHSQGLFHDRINPSTVLVASAGNVKIVGLLVEAALTPEEEPRREPWADPAATDVTALGKLLYAALVSRWPGEPKYGLTAAPVNAVGAVATPAQVNPAVPQALDSICDRTLSPQPRNFAQPLRTAAELVTALSQVLGTADAARDLERRVRAALPRPPAPAPRPAGANTASGGVRDVDLLAGWTPASDDPAHTRLQAPVPDGAEFRDSGLEVPLASGETEMATTKLQPAIRPGWPTGEGAESPEAADQAPARRPWWNLTLPTGGGRTPGASRLVWRILAGVVVVGLAITAGVEGRRLGELVRPGGTPSAVATQPVMIMGAQDFDPVADGGSGDENPKEVTAAIDGNPATAWHSVTYRDRPNLAGLKPGVGLILDLGSEQKVSLVHLTLLGTPYDVQLRAASTPATDPAPVESEKQWTTIATVSGGGDSIDLIPASPVTTRYLLIYFTSLPQVAAGRFQAAVAEVAVRQ